MRSIAKTSVAVVAAGAISLTLCAHAASAIAPDSPQPSVPESAPLSCVPYLGDPIKGYGQFPLGILPPDYGSQGWDNFADSQKQNELPQTVSLRDNSQGFNDLLEVSLHEGKLHARPVGTQTWKDVPTPECLQGNIVGISVNNDALVAVDSNGWIYHLSNLLSQPTRWGWIRAWGGPVWLGKGMQVPTTEEGKWTFSLIETHGDKYQTPDGKEQPV